MLEIRGLTGYYGDALVLRDVNMTVAAGEIVSLVGPNGAGKSTLVRAISGQVPRVEGSIRVDDVELTAIPAHRRVDHGIVQVPEGRRLFPLLTVEENLMLGAYRDAARRAWKTTMESVLEIFPALKGKRRQLAGTMSGGEQQMCAIGRALMAQPKLLMLDEPSLGLAPIIVERMFEVIQTVNRSGVTILLVEQNVRNALQISHHGYVLANGSVVMRGTSSELLENEELQAAYMGL